MKQRILKDYSALYDLIDPITSRENGDSGAELVKNRNNDVIQAYCFDFQVKAINLTLYNRLFIEEQNTLAGIGQTIAMKDVFSLKDDEDQIKRRQQNILKRLKGKAEELRQDFEDALAFIPVPESFMLPESIIYSNFRGFIDEKTIRQANIRVVNVKRENVLRLSNHIERMRQAGVGKDLSALQNIDILTYLMCGLCKVDTWQMVDINERKSALIKIIQEPLFIESMSGIGLHTTKLR